LLVGSSESLSSLDVTRASRHGFDLLLAASYSANKAEDEDMAGANHRHPYAPDNGFTTPVPRFRDDIAALQQLTSFELPPLRVVRPTQVVQVFYGFGDASQEISLVPPCCRIMAARHDLQRPPILPVVRIFALDYGLRRRKRIAKTSRS